MAPRGAGSVFATGGMMIEIIFILAGLVLLAGIVSGLGWLAYKVIQRLEHTEDGEGGRSRAALWRFGLVGGIALTMLIPLALVGGLVEERAEVRAEAVDGIVGPWGRSQVVAGPVLVVPVMREEVSSSSVDIDGIATERQTRRQVEDALVILPRSLTAEATLEHEERERGIHKAVVYGAPVRLEASFDLTDARRFVAERSGLSVGWERASLAVGLSDLRSLRRVETVSWNGREVSFSPGAGADTVLGRGFHAPAPLNAETGPQSVSIAFRVNGSARFSVVPVGETSRIRLASSWPHPSFFGAGLPETREVGPDGFSAVWSIPSLARDFPQVGLASQWKAPVTTFSVGASLFEPVSLYSVIERAVKYGVLFVALTFALFLALEFQARGRRLHPVQYVLVGLSMATFYLSLLALAEHISFVAAYAVAGAVSAAMIGLYVGGILRALWRGLAVGAGQGVLYAVLFVILQLEDYALLVGAGLVLVVLGLLMAATQRLAVTPTPAPPPAA